MKFKNHFNADQFESDDEINKLPGKTVPDQSMTVMDIMRNQSRGLPLTSKVPVYHGDVEYPNLSALDLFQRHELLQSITDDIKKKRAELIDKKQKAYWDKVDDHYKKKYQPKETIPAPSAGNSQTPTS